MWKRERKKLRRYFRMYFTVNCGISHCAPRRKRAKTFIWLHYTLYLTNFLSFCLSLSFSRGCAQIFSYFCVPQKKEFGFRAWKKKRLHTYRKMWNFNSTKWKESGRKKALAACGTKRISSSQKKSVHIWNDLKGKNSTRACKQHTKKKLEILLKNQYEQTGFTMAMCDVMMTIIHVYICVACIRRQQLQRSQTADGKKKIGFSFLAFRRKHFSFPLSPPNKRMCSFVWVMEFSFYWIQIKSAYRRVWLFFAPCIYSNLWLLRRFFSVFYVLFTFFICWFFLCGFVWCLIEIYKRQKTPLHINTFSGNLWRIFFMALT